MNAPSTPPTKRSYSSPRRSAQAQSTRLAIAEAARAQFLAHGWAATRVRDVAWAAGVAEPTVYATYTSKAGLALALIDAVDDAADVPRVLAEIEASAGDPRGQLAAFVAFDRRVYEQAGDVVGLLRDGAPTAPELAAAYAEGRARGDRARLDVFGRWPKNALRAKVTVQNAVDMYAAMCSIDVYRELTSRGWSPQRIEAWWNESLGAMLLAPARTLPSAASAPVASPRRAQR